MDPNNLSHLVLAAGALGLASYGVVDALKNIPSVALLGYKRLRNLLGPLYVALAVPYGPDFEKVLQSHYRTARTSGDLPRTIRQGARLALTPALAAELARNVDVVDPLRLIQVAERLKAGRELEEEDRAALGRYELAVDARIDAALQIADNYYTNRSRLIAAGVAVFISLLVAISVAEYDFIEFRDKHLINALVVGFGAVPLAPIAKDLANAINSAQKALRK